MKTLVMVLLCLEFFNVLNAQDKNLTGSWDITSWTNISDAATQGMTEDQLKADNQVTIYYFLEEGKFKQTTNMAGSGSMDTYEGTWKTSGDKLTIVLKLGEQNFDLEFTYELKDNNNLILTRFSPDNSIKVINTFRRKI